MKNPLMILALTMFACAAVIACAAYSNRLADADLMHEEDRGAGPRVADEGHSDGDAHDGHEDHDEERIVVLTKDQLKKNNVEVATAGPGELSLTLALSGEVRLNADRVAHVVPRVPGVVRKVYKNTGDQVSAGDVMAILDSRELAALKAAYLGAKERESLARATFVREKGLWEKRISAEQDYLAAKQALAEASINARSAEQQLLAVGFSEDYLKTMPTQAHVSYTQFEMIAPFDGTVIEKHIAVGESLKEDVSCFTIADLRDVWVNLSVYQKDIPAIRKGQEVVISAGADPANGTRGTISYFGPMMGEETRTAIARVVLSNESNQWRPGQFVTGFTSIGKNTAAVLIPNSALQTLEKVVSVFVETENGFVPAPVKLGRAANAQTEIVSGLTVGQRYAATGSFILKAMLEKGDVHNH